jgi:hypothetical protein
MPNLWQSTTSPKRFPFLFGLQNFVNDFKGPNNKQLVGGG